MNPSGEVYFAVVVIPSDLLEIPVVLEVSPLLVSVSGCCVLLQGHVKSSCHDACFEAVGVWGKCKPTVKADIFVSELVQDFVVHVVV